MHSTTTRGRLRGLAALATLLALTVGTPLLLSRLAGSPIPNRMPDLARLRDALTGTLDSDELTNTLVHLVAVVAWCAWVVVCAAIAAETLAALQHRSTRTVRQLAAAQHVARRLIAPIALAVASLRPAVGSVAITLPARQPAVTVEGVAATASARRAPQPSATRDGVHVVAARETLLDIARAQLGDASRWRDIFQLNAGRLMADGTRLERPEVLHAGWTLQLPPIPTCTPAHTSPAHATATAAAPTPPDVYVVRPGDTLWGIVSNHEHRDATIGEIDVVFDANRGVRDWRGDHPLHDPNLVNPGMRLNLAPLDPPARVTRPVAQPAAPPTTTPAAPPTTAASTTTVPTSAPTTSPTTTTPVTNAPTTAAPQPNERTRGAHEARPWLAELALLATGVLAAAAALRRRALRAAQPGDTATTGPPNVADTDARLHHAATEHDARLAAAIHTLAPFAPQAVQCHADHSLDVLLATPTDRLPAPWKPAGGGNIARLTPKARLAESTRSLSPSWVELGAGIDGSQLYVDLAATGGLDLDATGDALICAARALVATLCVAERGGGLRLHVVGFDAHGIDPFDRVEHHDTVDDLARAVTARDPDDLTIVITTEPFARTDNDSNTGLIVIAPHHPSTPTRWRLRLDETHDTWTVEPLGITVRPPTLAAGEIAELAAYYEHAATDIVCDTDDIESTAIDRDRRDDWSIMIRMLGPVELVNRAGEIGAVRRKPLEALVWLAEHREHATRAGLEGALWTTEVSPEAVLNVISEARRALRALGAAPDGDEWLSRTLELHREIVSDVEIVTAAIRDAHSQEDATAVATLEPAVALLRGTPLAGTNYLWADAESIPSRLTLLGVRAAAELATRYLALGDNDGALAATAVGLAVLPAHEQLVCLRMQAHAARHDLASLRAEYSSYERIVVNDDFADGEVSSEVAATYRRLSADARMRPAS